MAVREPTKECSCEKCVNACRQTPGWFMPGEAERAANLSGVTFDEFRRDLIKDHASLPMAENAPYIWSPRKVTDDPLDDIRSHAGQRVRGTCVFLKGDRCSIHAAKPYECRVILACDYQGDEIRDELEAAWVAAGAPLGFRPERDFGDVME